MMGIYIGYMIGVIKVSGFVNLRERKIKTHNMELYNLIHSFSMLTLVMIALSNVC